jgi:predicted MFS family arabinose efflux permease
VLLGGALTELVGWRAIFVVNLPVSVLLAAGALHVIGADPRAPRWSGLDLRGALLATLGVGGLVYALSQAESAGWTSAQTLGIGAAALATLALFGALERRATTPLLRVERLTDRAVGGGFVMMLAVSAVMFGSFLLSSLYLQNVLGTGALETGLGFLPFAVVIGVGVHAAGHLIARAGVRIPMASGFAIVAGGLLLLSQVSVGGSYFADVLPGMLITGIGLGMILVSVSVSVLTGAADEESGMLSGLNTTGHEVGGSLGIAVLASIAAGTGGIGDAFLVAAVIAGAASIVALVMLPAARHFLPKLALAPRVAVH